MSITVGKLTNASVFVDGIGTIGQVQEIDLPTVTQVMADHEALGMMGKIELPSGIDKLEARIAFNALYPAMAKLTADPTRTRQFQVLGSVETHTSAGRVSQVPMVVTMNGTFKSNPLGSFKQHENVVMEAMINVITCKQQVGDEVIMDVDVFANRYIVNGEDIMATYRANIGQ
jgi:P2 family phage contractile tail tube protein